jgi:hypothetical protein
MWCHGLQGSGAYQIRSEVILARMCCQQAEVMTMSKPKTELTQRCPPPPYTRWDQRGKPVLLSYLKLINGKRLHLSLETDDPDIARQHMRLLVAMLLAERRLSPDSGSAKVYGPKGTSRPRLDSVDTEVRRLKALSEAEFGSEALATAKHWGRPVGIIHHLTGRKPALSARTYATRRVRARQRGQRMPIGDTWEHHCQGGKYFGWNGKVLTARLQIGGRSWQWPLKGIDEEKAEALMRRIRVARERLHQAAVEELNCELGTIAAADAAVRRERARAQLARAIITAGGPEKLAEFVMKGPQEEVGMAAPERAVPTATLGATRGRQAAEKECKQLLSERYQAYLGSKERPVNDELKAEMSGLIPKLSGTAGLRSRSEAIRATDGALARTQAGRPTARQVTREEALLRKPRGVMQITNRKAKPFMQWARGPGGKLVLQCAVYLLEGSRLSLSLNTSDAEVEGPKRMRLLLWHAIVEGQLPCGFKHSAWALYGGPIPQSTKRLLMWLAGLPWGEYELLRTAAAERLGYHASTIDWLTKQEKSRRADPVRRARARTIARSRARKDGKLTPISRSWQLGAVGGILAVHSDSKHFYAQFTIAGFTLRWPLAVQNRAEGEALVKPAVDARARIREAARHWRECPVGSPEAKTALTAVLGEQRRFRDALLSIGARRSNRWAEVVKVLKEPPVNEAAGLDGCTRWFVELLVKNPERPPPGRRVPMLLEDADTLFHVGGRGARRCYEFAQEKTGNRNWSTTRRPRKSAS